MSVKIKVSYETEEELAGIVRLLSPAVGKWKRKDGQAGKYKKAYGESQHITLQNDEPQEPA